MSEQLPASLEGWLQYISRTHSKNIQLGLERSHSVYRNMLSQGSILSQDRYKADKPAPQVITFAGTNGKGSTLAMVEALALRSGKKTGAYTSPHLIRFNERIRINGNEAPDRELMAGFNNVEKARYGIPLTYFEYATLAALELFLQADLDLWLLEVGLGGRLDAVNIIDPDIAIITTVDLDHQEWLGDNREAIGFEKAGILRAGIPLVVGCSDPPSSVLKRAAELSADTHIFSEDFDLQALRFDSYRAGNQCTLSMVLQSIPDLPIANIATALQVARLADVNLQELTQAPFPPLHLAGRFQQVATSPAIILDVAHNPHAARYLSAWLAARPAKSPQIAVFSALCDKDITGVVAALIGCFQHWHLFEIDDPRAAPVEQLAAILESLLIYQKPLFEVTVAKHKKPDQAFRRAIDAAGEDGRVVVFGSFLTVSAVLETGMIQTTY